MFSVCVLCYGDHEDLARACLGSVLGALDPARVRDVRVGLNAACDGTRAYVRSACAAAPVPALLWDRRHEPGLDRYPKYPLMRRMFYDVPLAPYVMWFDDDSRLVAADAGWWRRVHYLLVPEGVGQVGQVWYIRPQGNQEQAVCLQPWYAGKPLTTRVKTGRLDGDYMAFATGGWWAARSAVLERWDYPFPELYHNGGDVMLGQLLHQQGLVLANGAKGVEVNAAPRRGLDTKPLWSEPDRPLSLSHHDFECRVEPLNDAAGGLLCGSRRSGSTSTPT